MLIYDISMTISNNVQVYKNKPEKKVHIGVDSDFEHGSVYESWLKMNLHSGTHIDMPKHVSKEGSTSDSFDIESCLGDAIVLDFSSLEDHISKVELQRFEIREKDFVILKTKNSFSEEFLPNFTYLDESGSLYLKNLGVVGVGTDGLGIERNQPGHPTHHNLLDYGIHILEGLRLKDVPHGRYDLICLPLKIENVEALPARVYLKTKK
ncbi:MAG: cyclase family protein [Firmicutes bacterium]|nr:cyclase family protein [Bacillota bacterium]